MIGLRRALLLGLLCVLGPCAALGHDEADDRPPLALRDKIRIVSISPAGPVKGGVETEFTIKIDVDLGSAHEGWVRVGFNLDNAADFRMVDRQEIHEGRHQLSFRVKVVPVNWGERGAFTLMANVGPKPTETRWTPTAFVRLAIPVKS
jgi:hypothetical protein